MEEKIEQKTGRYRGLIALDMDGTWLRDDKSVSDGMRKTVRDAQAGGFLVIPATGRPIGGLTMEVMSDPGIRYAVTANGASAYRIIDYAGRKWEQLFMTPLPPEKGDRIMEICRRYDLDADCFVGGIGHLGEYSRSRLLTYGYPEGLRRYIMETKDYVPDLYSFYAQHSHEVEKIMLHIGLTPEKRERRPAVEAELARIPGISVVCGGVGNFEITDEKAAKGLGLLRLAGVLGIDPEKTMACGDEENDLDMIRRAAFGVAMGNAPDSVKAQADFVTGTNEEDGAARAIRLFMERCGA